MSDPMLSIQYSDTVNDLVIHAADGSQTTVTMAANSNTPTQSALTRPFLLSQDLRDAVKAGTIAFDALSNPTADEQRLAIDVMRSLLSGLGPELLTMSRSMLSGEKALEKQRDAYNVSYNQVKKVVDDANVLQPGTQKLADAADALLKADVEAATVTAAQQALDQHDADFLALANGVDPVTQAQLDDYLSTRVVLEETLVAAQAAKTAADNALTAEFGVTKQALQEASWAMQNLTSADIGSLLAWTWSLPAMP